MHFDYQSDGLVTAQLVTCQQELKRSLHKSFTQLIMCNYYFRKTSRETLAMKLQTTYSFTKTELHKTILVVFCEYSEIFQSTILTGHLRGIAFVKTSISQHFVKLVYEKLISCIIMFGFLVKTFNPFNPFRAAKPAKNGNNSVCLKSKPQVRSH